MNRISSTAVTVALAATLLAATAPAAQARNLAKPQPSASVVAGGLFDAALSWLGSFFVTAPHGQAARPACGRGRAQLRRPTLTRPTSSPSC